MKILNPKLIRNISKYYTASPFSLQKRTYFSFSQQYQNVILQSQGILLIRNSQTLNLKLRTIELSTRKQQDLNFQMSNSATLATLSDQLSKKFNADDFQFLNQNHFPIAKCTPLQVFLNREFTIVSLKAGYKLLISGQLFKIKVEQAREKARIQLRENLSELELPVISQRQIQSYFNRIQTWIEAKYGPGSNNQKLKVKDVQDILVQSILDPQCNWGQLNQLQMQWQRKYQQVRQLREKKEEAIRLSQKKAARFMSIGLGVIALNIGGIWGGTYVVYSWDIIEPIAYFSSSFVSIFLFGQVLKTKKPFSLSNYREYLANKYLTYACSEVGLNLSDLETKQMQLQIIESTIKDYLICKL